MSRYWYVALFSLIYIHSSIQKSTPESPKYVAAVVEYSPDIYNSTGGGKKDILLQNAEHYVDIIKTAADQSADIIVFPECGLQTLSAEKITSSVIPNPEDGVNPCYNATSGVHEAIRLISCAARENGIYIIVNIPENKTCDVSSNSNCTVYYNTDVAFDRDGKIIARYRKFNLFGEPGFNITEKPDISVFETDFGVKFGIFTCFDIIFEKPALTLVKELGITDVIYPTAWFSELPFLSAVQEQAAWSQGLGVNFLGSGYNNPSGGSTGSGIYSAKQGVLTSIMAAVRTTKILVASVPKISTQILNLPSDAPKIITDNKATDSKDDSRGILMMRDYLQPYTTFLITEKNEPLKKTLCSGEFCCDFDIQLTSSSNSGYFYRLAVFEGVRSYVFATGGLQICAVVFCTNENLSSCGIESKDPEAFSSTFDYINITGEFHLNNAVQLPNTLVKGYDVLLPSQYSFTREENASNNIVKVKMQTKTEQSSLLTFGIYGRDFLKDGQPATYASDVRTNTANNIIFTVMIIIFSFLFTFTIKKFYH